MRVRTSVIPRIACHCMLVLCGLSQYAMAEITDRHREFATEVFDRLLAVMEQPEGWESWPPELTVIDPGVANAYAGFNTIDGVDVPFVHVTVNTIEDVAEFKEDALAFTLGHELGHLHFHHSHKAIEFHQKFGEKLRSIRLATGREQELEADLFGMKLAFKAGYSRRGLLTDLNGWRSNATPYCRFEGLSVSHPPWEDRAVFLMDDAQQKSLWQSLSSFQTGVMFLENQHYKHAQICFENVTEEFPECYEAWANLGYSLLMRYCDALDEEDIRRMDIGHLVVGGFYRRPDSLEPTVRGSQDDLWFEAVGAFREALRLKERLNLDDEFIMVKANLGVAYLVHPGGKDVGQSEKWFDEVFTALASEDNAKELDPLVYASILINSGSARGFNSELIDSVVEKLAEAKKSRANNSAITQMESALQFNQARALTASDQPEKQNAALTLYEQYLDGMTTSSSWWPMAYEQYAKLAKASNKVPKDKSKFRQLGIKDWRHITEITLKNGATIGLSQSIDQVLKELGPADIEIPVIEGTNLKYHKYPELGVTILATREVLAVILDSDQSPIITIRRPGLGGDTRTISIGMKRSELESLLGGDWDVEITNLFDLQSLHHLYRHLGLGVQFKNNIVSELVIVVVPLK